MAFAPLATGETITLQAGAAYEVEASIKTSHTQADIEALVTKKGATINSYDEEGPDPDNDGYRLVQIIATATTAGSIPWSVPWPASLFDASHIITAWSDPNGYQPTAPDPDTPVAATSTQVASTDQTADVDWGLAAMFTALGLVSFGSAVYLAVRER